jgi:putative ABC transport system permease protein
MPDGALARVRGVTGVATAVPLTLASADVRFADGRFGPAQVIGLDDATLAGLPPPDPGAAAVDGGGAGALREPDATLVADGGSEGKLQTPIAAADQWPRGGPHLGAPTRPLAAGDEVSVNDARVRVAGRVAALPRFPPRPLLYMSRGNALRVLPLERRRLTFVLATAAPGVAPADLAARIEAETGLRARAADDFEADTVAWNLENSEDVGDVGALLAVALLVGLGVTGVMLYLFTQDNLRHYAVLAAMGAGRRTLVAMVLAQAGACAALGGGVGIGLCAVVAGFVGDFGLPFRLMWFAPLAGGLAVLLVTTLASSVSLWPVLKLQPATVFAAR